MNRIVCRYGEATGWLPIDQLIRVAAAFLDAEIAVNTTDGIGLRTFLPLPYRRGGRGGDLYIARSFHDAARMMSHIPAGERRAWRILWIVDSFHRPDRPKPRCLDAFDVVAVMQKGELEHYARCFPREVLFCGWGADVAGLFPEARDDRDIDVLRVGRQPDIFEDDARTAAVLEAAGLSFAGRPPRGSGPGDMDVLCDHYGRSRFLLASSNLVDGSTYTYKDREYLTGRWTDALAAGCVVAGRAPLTDVSCGDLLWPGATAEVDVYDLDRATGQLVDLVAGWSMEATRANHRMAIERLDWRRRLKLLAEAVGHSGAGMTRELERLRDVEACAAAAGAVTASRP